MVLLSWAWAAHTVLNAEFGTFTFDHSGHLGYQCPLLALGLELHVCLCLDSPCPCSEHRAGSRLQTQEWWGDGRLSLYTSPQLHIMQISRLSGRAAYLLWGRGFETNCHSCKISGSSDWWRFLHSLPSVMTCPSLGWSWTVLVRADILVLNGLLFLLCHGPPHLP